MSREHNWVQNYPYSDVQLCTSCPIQRRRSGDNWAWRPTSSANDWTIATTNGLPPCGSQSFVTTDTLENELKVLSEQLAIGQARFDVVRRELKTRRETRDEQPPMEVDTVEKRRLTDEAVGKNLVLKITAMEAEQAKLVLEAEMAKAAQLEAENRLTMIVKAVVNSGLKDALVEATRTGVPVVVDAVCRAVLDTINGAVQSKTDD